MAVRVRLKTKSIKPELDATIEETRKRIDRAADSSSEQFADNVLSEGRADIASAGRFGSAWTSGFNYEISGRSGGGKLITFTHSNPLWRVFQSGAYIRGKPLLWIPVEPGGPRARDFPGRLFQVKRRKKRDTPLLMSEDHRVRYIGVKAVSIKRKFHLKKIIRDEAKKLRDLFSDEMKKG
jgi:hypothetical protein